MTGLLTLIPLALLLGLLGLVAFLWSLGSGQFDDPDGAAARVLIDIQPTSDTGIDSATGPLKKFVEQGGGGPPFGAVEGMNPTLAQHKRREIGGRLLTPTLLLRTAEVRNTLKRCE